MNFDELDVCSENNVIHVVSKDDAWIKEDSILFVTKNAENSSDKNLLPKSSKNSDRPLNSDLLPQSPERPLYSDKLPQSQNRDLLPQSQDMDLLPQPPERPLDMDLLPQPPERPLDMDLLPQPPERPLDMDLLPQPPERPLDMDLLPQPPERPLDMDLLPQPPERPLDMDLLPQPPERPLDMDLLPQPPERPLDMDLLPQPPERPLDMDLLPQPPERPLDMDLLPQPPERPHDSDCCGTGCVPCVFDIHMQEMKIWERECQRVRQRHKGLHVDIQEESAEILAETEYHQFTLASITRNTKDTQLYRFHLPMDRSLGLKLGQHVILRGDGVDGDIVTRQYTPVSDVNVTDYFELLIKVYEEGKMSQYISTWRPGTIVDLRGPFGEFSYAPNKHSRLLMLAAGSGIAPMTQVIQGVLNNEEDETRITLLYACRCYSEILLKSWLDEWTQFWNFSVLYVLSKEPVESGIKYRYGDNIHVGRLDKDLLANQLQTPTVSSTRVLISGTKSFDKDMLKYCKVLGIQDCDIHKF